MDRMKIYVNFEVYFEIATICLHDDEIIKCHNSNKSMILLIVDL